MKNKGITLISLVVTIVVLLILAGITIGTVFSDNGIIKKAQEAANATEQAIRNEQEGLNSLLDQMNGITNDVGGGTGGTGGGNTGDGGDTGEGGNTPITAEITGKITWSTGSATLELTVDTADVTIQYRKNGDTNWEDYKSPIPSLLNGDKVYAKGIKDGKNVIEEKQFDILDQTSPTVTIASISSTTNSISATATATDNEAGMGSSSQYIFYIKKTVEADSSYVQIGNGSSTSVVKGDLDQNTSYTVKVETSDVAGNKGEATREVTTRRIGDATDGLKNGTIIASNPTWSGGTASTTLSTSTGLTIQYQVNSVSGSWNSGTKVTGLNNGDTIFARLTDGKNYGGEASVTILDTINPQSATISLGGTSANVQATITATVTLRDNESGVNAKASKWVYNTISSNIGTNESSYTNNFSYNGQNISLIAYDSGTYYLHVLTVDNAGNKIETKSQAITINQGVTGITVAPTSSTLVQGDTVQLVATVLPDNAYNKNVVWSTDNSGIATVNNGRVTAISPGQTTIRVTATDGSNKSATCSITVTAPTADTVLEEGDFVYYVDKKGSKRKCAVLYEANSQYGLQIVAMELFEEVGLGNTNYTTAMNAYNNAIKTLNDKAMAYNNTTYSTDARCIGSKPNDKNAESTTYYSVPFTSALDGKMKNSDENYVTDYNQLEKLNSVLGKFGEQNQKFWYASRFVNNSSNSLIEFGLRWANASSGPWFSEGNALAMTQSNGNSYGTASTSLSGYYLRPVFTLKSGLKITGGEGTKTSPYELGV